MLRCCMMLTISSKVRKLRFELAADSSRIRSLRSSIYWSTLFISSSSFPCSLYSSFSWWDSS